jgi:hypothetical protein
MLWGDLYIVMRSTLNSGSCYEFTIRIQTAFVVLLAVLIYDDHFIFLQPLIVAAYLNLNESAYPLLTKCAVDFGLQFSCKSILAGKSSL